ncbi:MAG TPA: amylo-alpha-1,6-glucosidase [Gemmataceae bacterium]|nr:amylo-alpha-1,6-glucosidase [Gemmataceae bacterium]
MNKGDSSKYVGTRTAKPRRGLRGSSVKTGPFYIVTPSPLADELSRVLKHGETFAVFDHYGDIKTAGLGEEGLYHEGTRFLSCLILRLGQDRPMFLSSTIKEDNDLLAVDLTNPDIYVEEQLVIPRGTLHLARAIFLWDGVCYASFRIRNYGLAPIQTSFSLHVEADFADIFEVRGTKRKARGHFQEPAVEQGALVFAYQGLDGVIRRTRLAFAPPPTAIDDTEVRFDLALRPKDEATFLMSVSCEIGERKTRALSHAEAFAAVESSLQRVRTAICETATSSDQFNAWLKRSLTDLYMMTTQTAEGPYPFAGVPWFSTVFGRDGLITALECLWFDPGLARGVLAYLAATQAREINPAQDAEPGKILHETRGGEMAALGEIPFGRYYGSVDATPLFVLLAGAYYERTGDQRFIKSIWPSIELALQWIDTYGDRDGDGFVEYFRRSPTGLVQQGWKDSHDSVFHADGSLAQGPIALCEVQGYVYAARCRAAELAAVLGHADQAQRLLQQARTLQERFTQAFWCEDLGTYALALDGDKRPCRVRSSNAGHCLFTGIASPEQAGSVARVLLRNDSFSGWGIRTLAATEVRYNPMSYHNGSVWPHDNALIAAGLDRYGLKTAALDVLTGLYEASRFVDLHRLPELFCGFVLRPGEGPTLYPVACAPQSWSAAAVFLLLQAALGLQVRSTEARICFQHPLLPESLKEVRICNLKVGEASVDLLLQRHAQHVGINVLRQTGRAEIVVVV